MVKIKQKKNIGKHQTYERVIIVDNNDEIRIGVFVCR